MPPNFLLKQPCLRELIMLKESAMNVRLTQHSEELLKQQMAAGEFRSPEEVIEKALETLAERANRRPALTLSEFEAALDALAEGSDKLSVLPEEATTRSGIYREHN